jgi:glycosyltransferase involved in cell wall biosynthesis
LVIRDDGSTDETVHILRRFARTAPFAVRVCVNEHNVGTRENFAQAIAQCRGDLILLADQDDLWLPKKVRRLKRVFLADEEIGLAFSDAMVIDDQQRCLPYRLWQSVDFSPGEQRQMANGRAVAVLLRHNVVCGATMAFRADLQDLLLPIPESWVHDGWIALMAAAVARCAAIAEPLVEYRRHEGQQIGAYAPNLYQRYFSAVQQCRDRLETIAEGFTAAAERLQQFSKRLRDSRIITALENKAGHFHAKIAMRKENTRRLPLITQELLAGHYSQYSLGWKSLAQDLFV